MRRFAIYAGDTLIGWSDLEAIDRSMATAFGVLSTEAGYERVRDGIISLRDGDQSVVGLNARIGGDQPLVCEFVHIADYSDEITDGGVEVSVHGITDPGIDALFPVA